MKRVRSGCILQTLVFVQRDDCELTKEEQLLQNREEFERYKRDLERNKTRYQLLGVEEPGDSSVVVHIRKQLNATTDVSEYFA